jgi:predicted ATPase
VLAKPTQNPPQASNFIQVAEHFALALLDDVRHSRVSRRYACCARFVPLVA